MLPGSSQYRVRSARLSVGLGWHNLSARDYRPATRTRIASARLGMRPELHGGEPRVQPAARARIGEPVVRAFITCSGLRVVISKPAQPVSAVTKTSNVTRGMMVLSPRSAPPSRMPYTLVLRTASSQLPTPNPSLHLPCASLLHRLVPEGELKRSSESRHASAGHGWSNVSKAGT